MGYQINIEIDFASDQKDIQSILSSLKRKFKELETKNRLSEMNPGDYIELQYEDALIGVEKFDI